MNEWDLYGPEYAWSVWQVLESFEWHFLPEVGGLLDQDDCLMRDLQTISWRKGRLKEMMKS